VVWRDTSFDEGTSELYDLATCNIYLFIGRSYLITVHAHPSSAVATLADRIAAGPDLMGRGVDYLAYAILDTITDLYFPLLDQVDHFIDEIETEIFKLGSATTVLERIFDLKRTLLGLRRQQAPMREILSTMANRPTPYLQPTTQVYFRDVYDHVVRQVESIENFRDLLTGALEIHFSVVSNRTNEIMKILAIVGTFLLPATWVASIYGMNFEWMPFLHNSDGFWIAMALQFGVSLGVFSYLKIKHWV
jgi:magnesium transporter